MPSIFSSRWIRGAPHNGFAVVIRLINGRISAAVQGRLHRRRERSQKPAVAIASLPYAQSGEAVSTVYHFLQIGLAGQADDAAQCHQRQSLTVMKMKTTDQAEAANGISERVITLRTPVPKTADMRDPALRPSVLYVSCTH